MDGIPVTVLKRVGESAVVLDKHSGFVPMAIIVDADSVGDVSVGDTVYISKDAYETSTPYGIDWEVLYPEGLCIPSGIIQKAMYSNGIITLDDAIANSSKIPQILLVAFTKAGLDVYTDLKITLGG